ncbi:MAG: hypothetical protein K5629_05570 [Eubacteriales bacterium]|nr:hypothetical protein [Eubacteriales bacterium]
MRVKGVIQQVDAKDLKFNGEGEYYLFCSYEGKDKKRHVVNCLIDSDNRNDFIPGDEIYIEVQEGVYEGERILASEYLIDHPENKGAFMRNHIKTMLSVPLIGPVASRLSGIKQEDIDGYTADSEIYVLYLMSSNFRWLLASLLIFACLLIAAPFTGSGFRYAAIAVLLSLAFIGICCLRFCMIRKKNR